MDRIEFHSHEQQDEFIYNLFNQKTGGLFLDVSCGNPLIGSNTYTLEKFKEWTGFCFDIQDVQSKHQWSDKRSAQFVRIDATTEEFTCFLKENVGDNVVDYISLDIDDASMAALNRIKESGIKFKAMTFEHEQRRLGEQLRGPSRELLESLGLVRLFEDVQLPIVLTGEPGNTIVFEDWWIHPDYFDADIFSIKSTGKTHKEIVEDLKIYKGHEYEAVHCCSQGWPAEYTLFHTTSEENEYKRAFTHYYGDWQNNPILVA